MHSLSNCMACAKDHSLLQHSFPGLPYFEPDSDSNILEISLPCSSKSLKESEITRKVMDELDNTYQSSFHHSFADSVTKYSKVLVHKETNVEKKKKEK